jgi:tRNA threonylcarbamoyladenosine biosynthesis protein TsaE
MLVMEVSLSRLPDFARAFVARLPKTAGTGACIVGLSGELGAGKTTFVQEVAKTLGVSIPVTSPTFVLAQSYPTGGPPFSRLIHIDAYRLSASDKDTLGWREYTRNPEHLIFVEWPERVPGGVLPGTVRLEFRVVDKTMREIVERR